MDIRHTAAPKTSAVLWRLLALGLLGIVWLGGDNDVHGVILLLVLAIMALCRRRFALPAWTVLIDQAACWCMIPYWPSAAFGFALPVFEAVKARKAWLALPALASVLAVSPLTFPVAASLLVSAFAGAAVGTWELQVDFYRREADRERKNRYELEYLKKDLLQSHIQTAYMAELTERHRIARELHDHIGHELAGAALALQAFDQLRRENDPLADDMFAKAQARLTNSVSRLRDTVHNMTPVKAMGVERMRQICGEYPSQSVRLQVHGDTGQVPVFAWSVLEPCLKEALTNATRHAQANVVQVSLDVGEHIVRLSVYNDGASMRKDRESPPSSGSGLRNLRLRARAAGGSLSTSATEGGFLLVCVLPLGKGDDRLEHLDRGR